jgi:hypothetical protein
LALQLSGRTKPAQGTPRSGKGENMTDQTIWKQELVIATSQIIKLPYDAKILFAQEQHDRLCLWFLFKLENSMAPQRREIVIHGTGHDITRDDLRHISSVLMSGGDLVFHIFEAE